MPRILIDPGHTGATDPGAVAAGVREADITLDVALRLADRLSEVPGLLVRLTRDRHQDLAVPYTSAADLRVRTNMANTWPADYYLSIHVNAASNLKAHGVETYHHPHASAEAKRVAQVIHRHLVPLFRADRGVKTANFAVLRETKCPAVLVELGFITNDEDRKLLVDPSFRDRLADALAAGVKEALGIKNGPGTKKAATGADWPFRDVPPDHFAAEAIAKVKAAGLMTGYEDGTFRPDQPVTRAELASVVARILERISDG